MIQYNKGKKVLKSTAAAQKKLPDGQALREASLTTMTSRKRPPGKPVNQATVTLGDAFRGNLLIGRLID